MRKKDTRTKGEETVFDVIVCGGGYVGSLFALLLDRQGFRVLLVEQKAIHTFAPDGRAFAINDVSLRIFASLDLDQHVLQHANLVRSIEVAEAHLLRGISDNVLHYDGKSTIGRPFGCTIESYHLLSLLHENILKSRVVRRHGRVLKHTVGDDQTPASVTLDDGSKYEAWLLAACDGGRSFLRKHADIPVFGKQYPNDAIVCTLSLSKPHHDQAIEYFFPTGPFAMVPLPGKRCNIIWCEERQLVSTLMQMPVHEFLSHLEWRYNGRFGKMTLVDERRARFPLSMHHAQSYFKNRLVLLGDAAHVIHPIAGLGVNLGFRDVYTLSHMLKNARAQGRLPGDRITLKAYQRRRRFDVQKHVVMTDGIDSLFAFDWPVLRMARQWGFRLINRSSTLKQILVREASQPSL